MDIKIVACTPNIQGVIAKAARVCYSTDNWDDIKFGDGGVEGLLEFLLKKGHMSPFEHGSITFYIAGISRACSHQLVRHRLASFSQKSQRYVTEHKGNSGLTIPPSIQADPEALQMYIEATESSYKAYRELCNRGIPKEDARYVLPNGQYTSLTMTMNIRELLHFFKMRMDQAAQWEIRELAKCMKQACMKLAPSIFR